MMSIEKYTRIEDSVYPDIYQKKQYTECKMKSVAV